MILETLEKVRVIGLQLTLLFIKVTEKIIAVLSPGNAKLCYYKKYNPKVFFSF